VLLLLDGALLLMLMLAASAFPAALRLMLAARSRDGYFSRLRHDVNSQAGRYCADHDFDAICCRSI